MRCWLLLGLALGCRPSPPMLPVADVKLLMQTVIEPAAEHYWDAVGSVTDGRGTVAFGPQSAEEWNNLKNAAYVVAESGNLLMMEGRIRDRGQWVQMARAMIESGRQAIAAAEKRDTALVFSAGGALYETCSACHAAYATPLSRPGDSTR